MTLTDHLGSKVLTRRKVAAWHILLVHLSTCYNRFKRFALAMQLFFIYFPKIMDDICPTIFYYLAD